MEFSTDGVPAYLMPLDSCKLIMAKPVSLIFHCFTPTVVDPLL